MINYLKFFSESYQGDKMIKISSWIILILFFTFLPYSAVAAEDSLKNPIITTTFQLHSLLSQPPTAFLDIEFSIHNPNNVTITLAGVKLKYYFNKKFLNEEGFPQFLRIPPNETKQTEVSAMVDITSLDEGTRDTLKKGEGSWDINGSAYFVGPSGKELIVPIKKVEIKQPPPVEYIPPLYSSKIKIEVEDENWVPVANASVMLISKETSFKGITNASGSIEFEIPTTNYTIRVSKEGFITREESLKLSVPSNVMKSIQLYRASKLIVGVRDETGKPIANTNVTLSSKDVGNFTKVTNASGIAEFEIPRANYTLSVSKKGYLSYEESLDLSKSATSTKVIQLIAKLTWWQKYWYLIAGVVIICIVISIVLKIRKKKLLSS